MSESDWILEEFEATTDMQLSALTNLRGLAVLALGLRIDRDHEILHAKRLGLTPDQIAKASRVSRATVYRAIKDIQELDEKIEADIRYRSDGEGGVLTLCVHCKAVYDDPILNIGGWAYLHWTRSHGWEPSGHTG